MVNFLFYRLQHACMFVVTLSNLGSGAHAFYHSGASLPIFQEHNGQHRTQRTLKMAAEDVASSSQLLDQVFAFKPLFNMMKGKAREQIKSRLDYIGTSWSAEVDELLRAQDKLEEEYNAVLDKELNTPDYYKKPFHAYDEGNLCWEAATEVEAAALSVHSPIYTEKGSYEAEGDDRLRSEFHKCMMKVLDDKNFKPKDVVDLGCSTGLSTMKLHQTFPGSNIIGVDLSPHMVAVANYRQKTRAPEMRAANRVSYLHGMAESTGLPDKSTDLVSICLVNHELPTSAARAIFQEARRIVRPGGAISLMDMNCDSESFKKLASNPFAFAGFKSTEPYLQEYANTNLLEELQFAGFSRPEVQINSPRHHTLVAFTQ